MVRGNSELSAKEARQRLILGFRGLFWEEFRLLCGPASGRLRLGARDGEVALQVVSETSHRPSNFHQGFSSSSLRDFPSFVFQEISPFALPP